jgi:hypothetical protein
MKLILGISALALCALCVAQPQLPKELSGRWSVASLQATNVFSLDDIVATSDTAFEAKLTWWTRNASCTVRKEPIAGRITPGGIAFDVTTKCNNKFVAELNRGEREWTGKAVTLDATPVTAELSAK